MRALLSSAVHRKPGRGGAVRRGLPLAVLLTVLVIVAAGLGGTARFTGARWYPHIGGGTSSRVPTKPRVTTPPAAPGTFHVKRRGTYGTWLLAVVIGVGLVVAASLLWRWLRGRWRMPDTARLNVSPSAVPHVAPPEPEPEPARLVTGIELALRTLAEEGEPADAVVRAWLGLQETAEESGIVRRASETPTEFASRVLGSAFPDPQPLHTLLRLYLRTRFGDHAVTADDVSAVRDALQQLLATWHATGTAVR